MKKTRRSLSFPLPCPPLLRDIEANHYQPPPPAATVAYSDDKDDAAAVAYPDDKDDDDAAAAAAAAAALVKDFSNRSGWWQTFVLALYEGLLSTAGLFIAYLQFIDNAKSLVIMWIAQIASNICTEVVMGLVKFNTEYSSKLAQIKREAGAGSITSDQLMELKTKFPSPWYHMGASVAGYAIGSLPTLLASLLFVNNYKLQLAVIVLVVCVAVVGLGAWVAVIMKVPVVKSEARFLIGGIAVLVISYATTWTY